MPELAEPWWLLALLAIPLLIGLRLRAALREGRIQTDRRHLVRCLALGGVVVALPVPSKEAIPTMRM